MSSIRWGWVWAEPHECLVVLRDGEVSQVRRGGAVFKWPGDAVARVDTSLRRLRFTADQITREKTGVEVTGLAVYRIVRPELAVQMLDLRDPEALTRVLTEMCVGATRRLVANLTLEDCLTRRKDALADELISEVAPVLAGSGRADDDTERGWGVVLDTIEIQDVRVLSAEVFDRLQAPYREQLALEALAAEEEVTRARARLDREAEAAREVHRRAMHAQEEARVRAERAREDAQTEHQVALSRRQLAAGAERDRLQATTAAEVHRIGVEEELTVARKRAEAEVEVARLEAEALRTRGDVEVALEAARREAWSTVSDGRLQELALTETLPRVAEAFAGSFDHAVVTGGDMGFLSAAVGQVVSTLDAFGVELGRRG
jgi:regulator of protease activity HflC (stomatin/prohibitin superfamily)